MASSETSEENAVNTYYVAWLAATRHAELMAEANEARRARLATAGRPRGAARVRAAWRTLGERLAWSWQRGWVGHPLDGRATYPALDRITAPEGGNETYGPAARPTRRSVVG